ncbi:hypothetical protein F5882DRAFT_413144 [Hyaloscypha sp. PMI_1271]|nr:hypothetical protein F5882DRAFT_413144 [Hyaloscypha sp. PMI_1271]
MSTVLTLTLGMMLLVLPVCPLNNLLCKAQHLSINLLPLIVAQLAVPSYQHRGLSRLPPIERMAQRQTLVFIFLNINFSFRLF